MVSSGGGGECEESEDDGSGYFFHCFLILVFLRDPVLGFIGVFDRFGDLDSKKKRFLVHASAQASMQLRSALPLAVVSQLRIHLQPKCPHPLSLRKPPSGTVPAISKWGGHGFSSAIGSFIGRKPRKSPPSFTRETDPSKRILSVFFTPFS